MAIPTENVGSLPRLAKLQTALRHYDPGKITREQLTREQDAACQDSIENMEAMASEKLGLA
jgi:methionine synthase II (cobalamin-independent)